ncbi:MAG: class I tRNA ligase family protein, partial [Planctomycetes bacterium]|nr:class I tRNA ligase family protein [Planctomycetota bacterium]
METIAAKVKRKLKFVKRFTGRELLGVKYLSPFECYHARFGQQSEPLYRSKPQERWTDYPYLYACNKATSSAKNTELYGDDTNQVAQKWLEDNPTRPIAWHVIPASFVTTDSGTGLVHIAPAFGEDDYELLLSEKRLFGPNSKFPPLINCVAPNGKFTDEAPEFVRGRWVKDCDKDINRDLKKRGLLFHQEQYRHDYPFCWRAEQDPLIQYPRESWFIRTSDFKEQMLANNAEINWLPEHIQDGRFGKFLASNVDWALSRERYWGTPLPIWVCDETGKMEAIGGYDELLAKPQAAGMEVWDVAKAANPELPDDLRVHKPYIDAVTYASPFAGGARMKRVTEVIDC